MKQSNAGLMFSLNAYSSDEDNLPLDQEDAQYYEDELTAIHTSDEEDNTLKDPTSSIEDIFRCPICLGRVRSAQVLFQIQFWPELII